VNAERASMTMWARHPHGRDLPRRTLMPTKPRNLGGAIGLAKQVITSLQIGICIGFCPLSTPEWAVHHNREEVARLAGYKSGLSGHSDSSRVKTIRSCSGDVL
jgi:hypothetical protein